MIGDERLTIEVGDRLPGPQAREPVRVAIVEGLTEELESLSGEVVFSPVDRGQSLDSELLDLLLGERGALDDVCEELEADVQRLDEELGGEAKAVAPREPL